MKRTIAFILAIVCLFAMPLGYAEAGGGSRGFLWRVKDEDNTVYLLGSVHYSTEGTFPLSAAIMAALDDAEHVAVERDIVTPNPFLLAFESLSYCMYTDGTRLKDVLDEETYAKVKEKLSAYGVQSWNYVNWRPVYVEQLLCEMMMGAEFGIGIDQFMMEQAALSGKPIHSIETAEEQQGALRDMPLEDQIEILKGTLAATEAEYALGLRMLITIWSLGSERLLAQAVGLDAMNDEYKDALLGARNERMIALAEDMLLGRATDRGIAPGDDVLFITGALHMIGKDGIVEGLRNKGYTVERMR